MHGGVAGKRTRLGSALVAGGVTNGPAELLDFLIPLWAGVALDAEPAEVGFLVAVELLVSVVLGIIEIAYVFLPGAIAMGVLPPVLHKVVLRIGRRAAMASGSVLSSAFAISLAWAPGPVVIAVLWILCGVAWAMVIPIEQAVVAERRPDRVGTAMGIYTAATLIGAAAGASAAGLLYAGTSWNIACFAAGLIILSGAVLGPWAISRLGVADKPRTRVPQ